MTNNNSNNSNNKIKRIGKSKYKYVNLYFFPDVGEKWLSQIPKLKWSKTFLTEKEAAIGVDLKLIQVGKLPVNILVQKD